VIALTDDAELAHLAHTAVAMPPDRHEALSPLPYAIAGQLFAYHLARAKGIDPSLPRGLNKVTSTR
jgi:glucosamine 6-phosphate synthetase-like amidotransferase/phosphosugar isomerase protein